MADGQKGVSRDLYSVFVGHLPTDVNKTDLADIFRGCGKIEDLFIVDKRQAGSYNYGFVRFKEVKSAVQAVKELHRWPIRGTKLVVDLSRDTSERIKKGCYSSTDLYSEEKGSTASSCSGPSAKGVKSGASVSGITTPGVKDVMYLSRVREAYVSLDLDAKLSLNGDSDSGGRFWNTLKVDNLMDDIRKADGGRVNMQPGTLPEEASVERIKEKLLLGSGEDSSLCREKVRDFVSALQDVMGTINTFLSKCESQKQNGVCEGTSVDQSDCLVREFEVGNDADDKFEISSPPDCSESSISDDTEVDGCPHGDSGVESDCKVSRVKAATPLSDKHQGNSDRDDQSDAESVSSSINSSILSSSVVKRYLAKATLGRGRGLAENTSLQPGFGRGIPVPSFNSYGRGFPMRK